MITLYQSLFVSLCVSVAVVLFILGRAKILPLCFGWRWSRAWAPCCPSSFSPRPFACIWPAPVWWLFSAGRPRPTAGGWPRLLIAVPVLPYALFLSEMHGRLDHLARLRQEFPLVSVADRLAYERARASRAPGRAAPTFRRGRRHALRTFEQRGKTSFRRSQLESLYWRGRDEFIQATGFGPIRMDQLSRDELALPPDPGPLPLPVLPPADEPQRSDPSAGDVPANDVPAHDLPGEGILTPAARPAAQSLEALHRNGAEDLSIPTASATRPT